MAFIGMRHPVWAPLESETAGQMPVYGTGVVVGGAISGTVSLQHNSTVLYADDVEKESEKAITGGTVSLVVDDLSDNVMAAIMGAIINEDKSVDVTSKTSPYGGYGYIRERSLQNKKSYTGTWIFKTQLSLNSENAQTKEQNTSYQTTTLDGEMLGVQAAADMETRFIRRKTFNTLEEAVGWLNGLANITGAGA